MKPVDLPPPFFLIYFIYIYIYIYIFLHYMTALAILYLIYRNAEVVIVVVFFSVYDCISYTIPTILPILTLKRF